jgi:CHAT domain-containing protein
MPKSFLSTLITVVVIYFGILDSSFYAQSSQSTPTIFAKIGQLLDNNKWDIARSQLDSLEKSKSLNEPDQVKLNLLQGKYYILNSNLNEALQHLQTGLNLEKQQPKQRLDLVFSFYCLMGQCKVDMGDFEGCFPIYEEAAAFADYNMGPKSKEAIRVQLMLVQPYSNLGQYQKALECGEKAYALEREVFGNNTKIYGDICSVLGRVWDECSNFHKALEYYTEALAVYKQIFGKNSTQVALTYSNLAASYLYLSDYQKALDCANSCEVTYIETIGKDNIELAYIYNIIGAIFTETGQFDKSIIYHEKAIATFEHLLGENHIVITDPLQNIGLALSAKREYAKAEAIFLRVLKIKIDKYGAKHANNAITYFYLAENSNRVGDHQKALDYIEKSIASNETGADEKPILTINHLKTIELKAKVYSQIKEVGFGDLEAQKVYAEWAEMLTILRNNTQNEASKTFFNKESKNAFAAAIQNQNRLARVENATEHFQNAFKYSEKSKSLLLLEAANESKALHFAGIPDQLLQKEKELRQEITDLETQAKESLSEQHRSKLFDLKRENEALKKEFETRYPDYFRIKYGQELATLEKVQSDLDSNQCLVEYFTSDSSIFIFLIKKEAYKIVEIKNDFPLELYVKQVRACVDSSFFHGRLATARYRRLSREYAVSASILYQKLIAPVALDLTQRVVIVTDGVLGYLPFEVLLEEKPQKPEHFHEHAYFIKKHPISYCFSATMLTEMNAHIHAQKTTGELLAFAPFFDGDTTLLSKMLVDVSNTKSKLDPLLHSADEAIRISRLMGGKTLLGKDATEANFVKMAGNYRILHLSTHGKANDVEGGLSFLAFAQTPLDGVENEFLFALEVYNLALNADLVVLSACETGIGQLQNGEGIISIARAFAYAGAKSIVTTLWSVDDAKSKDLMLAFYQNLKDGQSKDLALWGSKMALLQNYQNEMAHPFWWAGFVGIGDMR